MQSSQEGNRGFGVNYNEEKSALIPSQQTAPPMNRAYKAELSGALQDLLELNNNKKVVCWYTEKAV